MIKTKKEFAVIGKPISHSLSPFLHNHFIVDFEIDAIYRPYEVEENEIKEVINSLKNKELNGINVTVPYKKKIIEFLDELEGDAKIAESVNTVYLNEKNKLIGLNTDVYGFEKAFISDKKKQFFGKNALVLGAGGVSTSVILALKRNNIGSIYLSNRTKSKAENIKKKYFSNINIVEWNDVKSISKDMDYIINATSLGLKNGNKFDFYFEEFKPTLCYIDLIYNPRKTEFIKYFSEKNIKTQDGLKMLIYQGLKSFEIWNNVDLNSAYPELEKKIEAVEYLLESTTNYIDTRNK